MQPCIYCGYTTGHPGHDAWCTENRRTCSVCGVTGTTLTDWIAWRDKHYCRGCTHFFYAELGRALCYMPYFGTVKTDDKMHRILSTTTDDLYDKIYDALNEWQCNKAEARMLHDNPSDY